MSDQLHDLMHEAVREVHPDLDALVDRSRRRGLGIRRRRQALGAVGAAAAVGAIVLGSTHLAGSPAPPAAATPSASPGDYQQRPMTGRSVAAGLDEAVRDAAGPAYGGVSDVKGQASLNEAYAELRLKPSDSSGFSVVGVNVQPGFDAPEIYRCRDWQVGCSVARMDDGAMLMTYEEHSESPEGLGVRRVVDLLRADGVRVVASSSNGQRLAGNHWRVTRPQPPLTRTQLTEVVSQSWWGARMDERFIEAGARISSYTDLDADRGDWITCEDCHDFDDGADGSPTPSP